MIARITKGRMVEVLGAAPKPTAVRQQQFDGFDDTLDALASSDWDAIPEDLLRHYFHDLAFVELQADLFRHVFPACLKFWHASAMRDEPAAIGDADFTHCLLRGRVLTTMMSEPERARTLAFFVDSTLDRLDAVRVTPPADKPTGEWVGRFATLGLIAPIVADAWTRWWAFETPGQAVAAVAWASGLVYGPNDNPMWGRKSPEKGGGAPGLADWDADVYDRAWLEPNLDFLRGALTFDHLTERLSAAATLLEGEPEAAMAQRIAGEAQDRRPAIEKRIADLIEDLGTLMLERKTRD